MNHDQLLKWLRSLGCDLGFTVMSEYIDPDNGFYAEQAWSMNIGQLPILTFNIEESDGSTLLAKAIQWVGSSTEPRAWRSYALLQDEVSNDGLETALKTATEPHKTEFIHSLGKDYGRDNLRSSIERNTANIVALLAPYVDVGLPTKMNEALKVISTYTSNWPIGQPNTRLRYSVDSSPNRIESKPFCLNNLLIFTSESVEDASEAKLSPCMKVIPLSITTDSAPIFESVLMRLTASKDSTLVFSSEHRNYPFIFYLEINMRSGIESLHLGFDSEKSNIPQALTFWELVQVFESGQELIFTDFSGDSVISFKLV